MVNLMPYLTSNKRVLIGLFILLIVAIPLLASKYTNISTLPPLISKATKYQCPADKSFCEKGKDLIKDGTYLGLSGDLASKSAIIATFDGTITSSTTILPDNLKSEKLNTIYLDNTDKNLRAIYYFKGDSSASKIVRKGDQIGTVLNKIEAFNTSLIFQIIKGDPFKGEKLHLSSSDFES